MSRGLADGARWRSAGAVGLQVALGALLFCSPALLVGRPFVFYDSEQYFLYGETIAKFLQQALSGASPPPPSPAPAVAPPGAAAPGDPWIYTALTVMGARSPFYGLPAFVIGQAGSLWSVVAAQALLFAAILRRFAALAGLRRPGLAYLSICAGLAALSSAGFYASLLMPDIFASISLICAILLLFYADRLRRWEGLAWWGLMVAGLLMHTTHVLVVLTAVIAAVPALLRLGLARGALVRRTAAVLGAVAAAAMVNGAYQRAVQLRMGAAPQNPPFLTARLLADGPGRRYLAAACPEAGYALCAHRAKALDDSQMILWEDDRLQGVFLLASVAERRRLIAEQPRFVLGTIAYDPLGVASAAVANSLKQLVMFGVSNEFQGPLRDLSLQHYWSRTPLARQIPNLEKCRVDFRRCDHPGIWEALDWLHRLTVVAALLVLATLIAGFLRRPPSCEATRRMIAVAAVVVTTLAANALICGALSIPADRYQARLVWMAPLLAGLMIWRRREASAADREHRDEEARGGELDAGAYARERHD